MGFDEDSRFCGRFSESQEAWNVLFLEEFELTIVVASTGMGPRDIWDINPVYDVEFHYYYIESVFEGGLGNEPENLWDPHDEITIAVEDWEFQGTRLDPGYESDEEEGFDNEEYEPEEDFNELVDFIIRMASRTVGRTAANPIDLTIEGSGTINDPLDLTNE